MLAVELVVIVAHPAASKAVLSAVYEGLWTLTGITDHPHRFQ